MDVDTSQLRALAADLGKVGYSAVPQVAAVVKRTLNDTKTQLKAEASGAGIAEADALAAFITYDMTGDGLGGEVGPVKGSSGSFGFLYYGNSKNGPVLKDPLFAMQRNARLAEPFFLKALGNAL